MTPLTEIPVGYNLRGKTIVFTRTDLMPPRIDLELTFTDENPDDNGLFGVTQDGGDAGGETSVFVNYRSVGGIEQYYGFYFSGSGWMKTEYTFPGDRDYVVTENNLPQHDGSTWGFDYAFVLD